ncbi:MAG: MBL fold metallo-hydrolase [Myxococcota bacterium]
MSTTTQIPAYEDKTRTRFFVKFWGTRGSIPTPGFRTRKYGGNTSCVELRIDDTLIICDGGTGLRELGAAIVKRSQGQPVEAHLFFSHPHWDHIQGFPFFQPAYDDKNTFHIYGTHRGDQRIFRLLSGQMRSDYFPVSFSELGARILPRDLDEIDSRIDGVTVRAFEQHHPGTSFGFSFEKEGLRVVYATDNELDLTLDDPDLIARDPSATRRPPEAYLEFLRGADLVIADGQYTDHEYPEKQGWGHARATTVVDAAILAGVRQLAIYHHDPLHSDDDVDALIEMCRARVKDSGSSLVVFGAREGLELRVGA